MHYWKPVLVTLFITWLSACGGSNDSESSQQLPDSNLKPTVNAGVDQTLDERTATSIKATASDSDGTITRYAWTRTDSSNIEITLAGTDTDTLSFDTPNITIQQNSEVFSFQIEVTDNDGATATDSVDITVRNIDSNIPPTVNAGVDQNLDERTNATIQAIASDTDGAIVSYQWIRIDSNNIDIPLSGTNSDSLSFETPNITSEQSPFSFTFQIEVTDDLGAIARDTVEISVNNTDSPPSLSLGADREFDEDESVSIIAVTDSGSSTITDYQWSVDSPYEVQDLVENDEHLSFTTPQVPHKTNITVKLTITDEFGEQSQDTVIITNNPKIRNAEYSYYPDGSLKQDHYYYYTYDQRGQIKSVHLGNALGLKILDHTYDHEGSLVKKVELKNGIEKTCYYIGKDFQQCNGKTTTFYFANNQRIASTNSDNEISFYHNNHLGSPVEITNVNGEITEQLDYDVFGTSRNTSTETQYTFSGKELDVSNNYFFEARTYNAATATFNQPDPVLPIIGNTLSLHPYQYGYNNPLAFKDDSGELAFLAIPIALKVIDVAITSYDTYQAYEQDGAKGAAKELAISGALNAIPGAKIVKKLTPSRAPTLTKGTPYQVGKAGEDAVKSVYDIGLKEQITINGRKRIPDGIKEGTISEVKNVAYQAYTQQLKDYVDYAQKKGYSFVLYVRSNTKFSKELDKAIKDKIIILEDIPGT